MKSILQKIAQLSGLLGTADLNEWEQGFVENIVSRTESGDTTALTSKQVEVIDRIHKKHFA